MNILVKNSSFIIQYSNNEKYPEANYFHCFAAIF